MGYRLSFLLIAVMFVFTACDNNSTDNTKASGTFDVTISIVSTARMFPSGGVFNTPTGADAPAAIFPGESYEFSFDAPVGSKLSFATMMVQSNDFFYAPDGDGIDLFDSNGNPVSGDVTNQVMLWDAGTEANQEPGTGMDQAPRQSAANTGDADPDNTVRPAPDTYNNLPAVSDVIQVTLTANSDINFTVRITNVSTSSTLSTSTGTVAVPLSPGVFVVHTESNPLFTNGQADAGNGLEGIAEDGDPSALSAWIDENTGLTNILAPGVYAVHTRKDPLFTEGSADRGQGLEALAEDGDPSLLNDALATVTGVVSHGIFNTPDGASAPGPLTPGNSYSFSVNAEEGDYLSFATMFVQSNDLFYAPDGMGIALFNNGTAVSGDVTSQIKLWDAGTEVNEKPGFGANQAPRQSGANTGTTENGTVRQVNDGFSYPAVNEVIKVTIQSR
ncbi:MAG: hypothetical protein D6677_11725 [Calditrichaeota bacterium]|nr:MAG: hypothetical protein D6677_11725 [Calditrichota bacterium]